MTDTSNLEQYQGKRVKVVKNLIEPNDQGHMAVEIDGVVNVANVMGLLIKPRGRVMVELIEKEDIESIEVIPETLKPVRVKGLKEITHDNVRQHLADRHGYAVAYLGDLSEDEAFKRHERIDHEELAHYHGDEKPSGETDGDEADGDEDDGDSE